jgi:hypothetical protein
MVPCHMLRSCCHGLHLADSLCDKIWARELRIVMSQLFYLHDAADLASPLSLDPMGVAMAKLQTVRTTVKRLKLRMIPR